VPNRGVLNLPAGLDRPHHHFAGVNPDAGIECMPSPSGPKSSVFAQFLLHLECRKKATLRMVLVRQRRAEQGKDAIAGRLHDVALVAADCVDHDAQCRVDNRAGLFRVEIFHQFGRPLEVGKQRRDRLALALR
jgi:hypothetical protein